MSMVPTTEQRIASLEAEARRFRIERDEAVGKIMLLRAELDELRATIEGISDERDRLVDGIREAIKVCYAKGYLHLSWYLRLVLLDVAGDDNRVCSCGRAFETLRGLHVHQGHRHHGEGSQ